MNDFIKKNIRDLKPSATLAINEKAKTLSLRTETIFSGIGKGDWPKPKLNTFFPSFNNCFTFSFIAKVADGFKLAIFFFI